MNKRIIIIVVHCYNADLKSLVSLFNGISTIVGYLMPMLFS